MAFRLELCLTEIIFVEIRRKDMSSSECCQCKFELPSFGCTCCNPTWVARTAGWKKIKGSKNWYCCKCQIANKWKVKKPTEDEIRWYVCASCWETATAIYQKDVKESSEDVQPRFLPSLTQVSTSSAPSHVQPLALSP